MEDEDQKMMALKKAYAEIILNTSKEAAARIMESERKALRFQQDLCCVKDEALRMLLRLRQMIDFQTSEAEMISLRQRSRIEELEAQLHEAEDIIADLRTELKETKGELQKMRNKEVLCLNGQLAKVDAPSPENGTYNDRLNTTELVSPSPSDSEFQNLPISEIKDTPMPQRVLDNMGCNTTRQTDCSSESRAHNDYADNPDLVPTIKRSKEPELCINGCTQIIQALERNLLNGKLPHEDMGAQYSLVKNESVIEADEEGEGLHTVPSFKAKNMDRMKNLSELEDGKQLSRSGNEDQPVKVICRLRKRRTQYGSDKTTSSKACPHQLVKYSQTSPVISHCKTYSDSVNDRVISDEGACTTSSPNSNDIDYLKKNTELGKKMQHNSICNKDQAVLSTHKGYTKREVKYRTTLEPSCSSLDQLTESSQPSCFLSRCNTISYSVNSNVKSGEEQLRITENEAKMKPPTRLNPGLTLIKTDDTELVDNHMSVKEEDDNAGMVDAQSGNSDLNDTNTSEATDRTPSQGDKKRLLKYTFQRKRKKESLNNPDENSSPEKSTIKRRVIMQQNGASEGKKSNLINKSSRDSRRLAQVARQLISLSGKRW